MKTYAVPPVGFEPTTNGLKDRDSIRTYRLVGGTLALVGVFSHPRDTRESGQGGSGRGPARFTRSCVRPAPDVSTGCRPNHGAT